MSPSSQRALKFLVFVLAAYLLYKIGPAYVYDFQIQNMTEKVAQFKADKGLKEGVIHAYLSENIEGGKLPITEADFIIRTDGRTVTVHADWQYQTVILPATPMWSAWAPVFAFHDESSARVKR